MRVSLILLTCLLSACAAGNEPGRGDLDDGMGDLGETDCQNSSDDDGDGDIDCQDSDCVAHPACRNGEASCGDGLDDDSDGSVDCQDQDCDAVAGCEFRTEITCDDGMDNDADLQIDCNDADCAGSPLCAPEMICDDGLDNDNDTRIDCLDEHCDGLGICEYAAEQSCDDEEDNDGDGLIDCADSDCGGSIRCATVCPANSRQVILDPGDLPVTIADASTQTSTLSTSITGVVTKVALTVDVTHDYVGDVVLALESPAGTRVGLADGHGGSGENYRGTLFVDSAPISVAAGNPPFSGGFRPDESLESIVGERVAGAWILHADDDSSGVSGTLDSWQLLLCVCDNCEVGATCHDGEDNDGDSVSDCDDPDCSTAVWCVPETDCADGRDNDLDELSDCADDQCDGIDICEYGVEVSCADGEDNDGDGAVDCADTDCSGVTRCIPEADCHDGNDNDSDSLVDCLDPGCFSDATCEPSGEVSCHDGIDNDSDGMTDCDDSECSGGLACATACGPDSVAKTFNPADLPLTIVDQSTQSSTLSVGGGGFVTKVAVMVDVNHTWASDLVLTLESPEGTRVALADQAGVAGANFDNTLFWDTASSPIETGSAPFAGGYQPEQPLASYIGESVDGTWRLHADDVDGSDAGTLEDWQLLLCVCENCEAGLACNDGQDNDGDNDYDCDDADCASTVWCIPETACDDGDDNDLDELIDCADDQCDGVGICEFSTEVTCADGEDNDGDGEVDCDDADCAAYVACVPEVDCHDGNDNDGDSLVDCLDPGCFRDSSCEPERELSCTDGVDNDSDGDVDCDDYSCTLACAEAACAEDELTYLFSAGALSMPLLDETSISTTISVGQSGTVTRTLVMLSAAHSYAGDLDIHLVSPAGTSVELSTDNGGSNNDYTDTIFSDASSSSIVPAATPFTGVFKPEGRLATVNGEALAGDWTLTVADDSSGDEGTFEKFELAFCVKP